MHSLDSPASRDERGATLIELMIALVILTVGILAVGQLFPAGSRSQLQAHMTTAGNYHAQEKLEQLAGSSWTDASLTDGRHPASGFEALGSSGQWQRFYEVSTMASPLKNLKKVTVTVQWTYLGSRSVTSTTYVRR
jgi:prepilin-type N-terminal cleavage/methylation domain-containing protein